jgi:DNA-binding transcriptional ArsR family regulator
MADPTRRAILTRLAAAPATVGELAEPFDMSLPAVSKHLKVLERAGLLEREIVGRVHHCRAVLEPLRAAEAWMAQRQAFWDQGLESLRSFLNERPSAPSPKVGPSLLGKTGPGRAAGATTDRALAIVRRDPDGEWRIERLLE